MVTQILHASQWCWKHNYKRISRLIDKINRILCSADIPGCTTIAKHVAFPHNGLGVVVNSHCVIGEGCVINVNVVLGDGFPHDGTPNLGKNVWVGAGAFLGGKIFIPDNVIVGANSVLTRSVEESGVIVAGVPAKIIRHLTTDEIEKLKW